MDKDTAIERPLPEIAADVAHELAEASGLVSAHDLSSRLGLGDDDVMVVTRRMKEGMPPHSHDYYELCYVMEGEVFNSVGGEELLLNAGSLCVFGLHTSHALRTANPQALVVNVCLRTTLFESGIFAKFLASNNRVSRLMRGEGAQSCLVLADMGESTLEHSIKALLVEYRMAGFREDFRVDARVLMLLAHMSHIDVFTYYGVNARIMAILTYINKNCAIVSVPVLAREFRFSEGYISQYVKKRTGRKVSDFIRDARMKLANDLLVNTDEPVDSVAHDVGYSSYSHFHKLFVEHYGKTPGEARKFAKKDE